MAPKVHVVNVFAASPGGGNPAPIVAAAAGLSDQEMQDIARAYGHESGFVLPPPGGSDCDYSFRFWVPHHEMEMCGHATVGAVWLLDRMGVLPRDEVRIWTRSRFVEARVPGPSNSREVEISQPHGRVEPVPNAEAAAAEILSVLGVSS